MIEKNFSIREAIKAAGGLFKKNALFFILVTLAMIVISTGFSKMTSSVRGLGRPLIGLISFCIQIIIGLGYINLSIKTVRGGTPAWSTFFEKTHLFFRYLLASIVYGLILFIGFIPLFVVMGKAFISIFRGIDTGVIATPAGWKLVAVFIVALFSIIWYLIFGIKYQLYPYVILEKNLSIFGSFRETAKITKGARWKLLLFSFVLIMINIIAMLVTLWFFSFGLLLTMPITVLAIAFVYVKLDIQAESNTALPRVDPATVMTSPKQG